MPRATWRRLGFGVVMGCGLAAIASIAPRAEVASGSVREPAGVGRAVAAAAAEQEQESPAPVVDPLHAPLDRLLDLYVRDGFVYYRALKSDRSRFDRYIASLDVPPATLAAWSREQKMAFWINAYNALVLETVIDNYPIKGRAAEYPANSIRQIPGAFEKKAHRVAGRTVTLDEIDKTILAELKEPRALLALGRGAIGGGRLHSEAYTAARLEEQLAKVAAECVTRKECVQIEPGMGTVTVTPLFSWREAQFAESVATTEEKTYPGRSPVERAILHLIRPHVLPTEREFLAQNNFKVTYGSFNWRLNDLTGGMPDR